MAGSTPEETDRLVEQAISQQDIEALLDLFEPDAVFVDPESGAELRGHDEIREAAVTMFESDPRIEGTGPPKVFISGDVALVLSSWSLESSGRDGQRSRQGGTATDVMRRQPDGTWRYVIDNLPVWSTDKLSAARRTERRGEPVLPRRALGGPIAQLRSSHQRPLGASPSRALCQGHVLGFPRPRPAPLDGPRP